MIESFSHNRPWANPFNPEEIGTPVAVQKALDEYGHIQISLGRSEKQGENWINVDLRQMDGIQVVHDLENIEWPFPDASASFVMAPLIIEHIDPAKMGIIKFFNEVWRVLQYDKPFMFSVPYATSPTQYSDPGHTVAFNEVAFYNFDPMKPAWYNNYAPLPWKLENMFFQTQGIIEVSMSKRRIDSSYGCRYV